MDSYQHHNIGWDESVLGSRHEKAKQLFDRIRQKTSPVQIKTHRVTIYGKVAAAIVLLVAIGLALFLRPAPGKPVLMITKTTRPGQKSTIILSDGTEVRLNSESTLTYPQQFTDGSREVMLEGEAFFHVKRSAKRSFIVHTPVLKTTVLGTSFNVSAFAGHDQHVTVATGRVKVETADSTARQEVTITREEQAHFDAENHHLNTAKADLNAILAWKEGILQFEKVTFAEAARVLERWYNVRITLANEELKRCIIRGKYKEENLVNILESLKFVNEIDYRFDGDNHVTITGKGCSTKN